MANVPRPPLIFKQPLPFPGAAINAQIDQSNKLLYLTENPLTDKIIRSIIDPVRWLAPWRPAIHSQDYIETSSLELYLRTVPPFVQSSMALPTLRPNPLVSINAQQWLRTETPYLPIIAPFVQSVYDNPLRRNPLVGINSQEWTFPALTLPFTPKVQSTYDNPLRRNGLVGINSQEWTFPALTLPFTPAVTSVYVNPVLGTNRLVSINAQEWLTPSPVLPFTPKVQSTFDNPLRPSFFVAVLAQDWLKGSRPTVSNPFTQSIFDNPLRAAALNLSWTCNPLELRQTTEAPFTPWAQDLPQRPSLFQALLFPQQGRTPYLPPPVIPPGHQTFDIYFPADRYLATLSQANVYGHKPPEPVPHHSAQERLRQSTIAKIDRAEAMGLITNAYERLDLNWLAGQLREHMLPTERVRLHETLIHSPEIRTVLEHGYSLTEMYALLDELIQQREDELIITLFMTRH